MKKTNNLPELGAKVTVKAVMRRENMPSEHRLRELCRKGWRRYELKAPIAGVFVGVRVARDGYTENNGNDGLVFVPVRHQRVYLIAVSRAEIVRALPEDVSLLLEVRG